MEASPSLLPRELARYAYRAQQAAIRLPLVAAHLGLRPFGKRRGVRPRPSDTRALQRELEALLDQDCKNVEQGLYPMRLLFDMPVADYLRQLPSLVTEVVRSLRRSRQRLVRDLPPDVDLAAYPEYFRRNFHWQTDGYLSERSAAVYDVGVEFLFLGTADVMRRQIVPPVTRHLRARAKALGPARILDIACGTGSALNQLALAHPEEKYWGLDLSPYYLHHASRRLEHVRNLSLVNENAEHMPLAAASFDVVTSVFLFHELPARARLNVLAEMRRVLKPSGLLVIEDAAQLCEASDLGVFLENFAGSMNEPFFADYIATDLSEAISQAGFRVDAVDRCFLSKVVTATAI
ncbi:MAG TPA: class I SAM-dependent methyltransferase [Polyangiaceae bacterium]|jgi:ubiquinone/menaquinone biosynthesis C-methylase UbiE|nr:class I SAM-dependent methyltransferase [Polyangiaceae bacterium]